MPIEYSTVYQIARRSPDWPFACVGLLPVVAGAVILWGKRRFKWAKPHWLFAIFALLFGILWTITAGVSTLSEQSEAFEAYQKGDYQTVEGVVTDFHPMPYEGHQEECFSVQDQRFCYSDYEIAAGFHNAASHGGPIRAGLPVRIAYRDGNILRLEIPKDQTLTPTQSAEATKDGVRQWQQRTANDPFQQEMDTAFFFTATCFTLWWNLRWKRVMRFWAKPPYRPWLETVFRVFFGLNLLGAVIAFVSQVREHPLTKENIVNTAQIASIMCAVVTVISFSVLWMADRRDRKALAEASMRSN